MQDSIRRARAHVEDSEGLRAVLERISGSEGSAWRSDPEVAELMTYAARRYAALARKHGLDPWEAAGSAFDAMRAASTRRAEDPWAIVTRAVQVTCIAEERAQRTHVLRPPGPPAAVLRLP